MKENAKCHLLFQQHHTLPPQQSDLKEKEALQASLFCLFGMRIRRETALQTERSLVCASTSDRGMSILSSPFVCE